MKFLFKSIKLTLISLLLLLVVIGVSELLVKKSAGQNLYSSVSAIPHNDVGLLLGTGKFLKSGRVNLYYKYRIDATVELYEAGKIDKVLISGDNGRKDYDEPSQFKEDLVKRGIPAEKIHLDYAGFRTLDSVVRSKAVFGQDSITIISQPFHNERAVFIAKAKGIKAVGFNARDVSRKAGFKVQLRERLARVKVMLDMLVGKGPKYLGEEIVI
ncbi:MAG: vancomycin high temperature exclusion protein [Saprospiraceae bacterium]